MSNESDDKAEDERGKEENLDDVLAKMDIDKDFNVLNDPDTHKKQDEDRWKREEIYSHLYKPSQQEKKEISQIESEIVGLGANFLDGAKLGLNSLMRETSKGISFATSTVSPLKSSKDDDQTKPEPTDMEVWFRLVKEPTEPCCIIVKRGPCRMLEKCGASAWMQKDCQLLLLTHGFAVLMPVKGSKTQKFELKRAIHFEQVERMVEALEDQVSWKLYVINKEKAASAQNIRDSGTTERSSESSKDDKQAEQSDEKPKSNKSDDGNEDVKTSSSFLAPLSSFTLLGTPKSKQKDGDKDQQTSEDEQAKVDDSKTDDSAESDDVPKGTASTPAKRTKVLSTLAKPVSHIMGKIRATPDTPKSAPKDEKKEEQKETASNDDYSMELLRSSMQQLVMDDKCCLQFKFPTAEDRSSWFAALEAIFTNHLLHRPNVREDGLGWQYKYVQKPAFTMAVTNECMHNEQDESNREKLQPYLSQLDAYHGYSPLHYAVRYNHVNAIKLLLSAGADPNMNDADGVSVMLHAEREEVPQETVQLLQSHGGKKTKKSASKGELFGRVAATEAIVQEKKEQEEKRKQAEAQAAANQMSENMRLLQERGEKIEEMSDKARELNEGAENYASMAKKLKENSKKKAKWFPGLG